MVIFSSPLDFSAVAQILKKRSAAIRTEDDLHRIVNALDPALNAADVVWAALSARQKLLLCKYFELDTVFEEGGRLKRAETKTGRGSVKHENSHADGLYILVKGKATVACAGRSLIVHGGTSGAGQLRKVLGHLSLPSEDAREFFKQAEASEGTSLYHRFVSHAKGRRGNVTIHFEKGSTYVVLPESHSRPFLNRLNASLVARRVLKDIGIARLLCKRTHERECTRGRPTHGERKATEVFRFRSGQILIKEGDDPDRVLFLATGSCLVVRKNEEREFHCVGSVLSPCFVGLLELFGRDDGSGDGTQSASIVAAADGHAFSFCSRCFLASVEEASSSTPEVTNAFRFLARFQMAAWAIRSGEKEEERGKGGEDASATIDDDVEEEEEVIAVLKAIDTQQIREKAELKVQLDEPGEEYSANTAIPNETSEVSLDANAGLSKGKLNRSKFLSAIHESMSVNLGRGVAENDSVHDREKWLLDGDKSNILFDVIEALSEDCGVDITTCEGDDPFHDFVVEEPAAAEAAAGDLCMLLRTPPRAPNGLRRMADKCLGRKRPPEYDDSDPFLKPYPSVVSRKMHGKTLPVVRRLSQLSSAYEV